jgi:hydrogenase/urease accessory protein HupE
MRHSRLLLVLPVLVSLAAPAAAHPTPFSYLDLVLTPSGVEGSLAVHIIDAAHELGIDAPERLLDPQVAEQQRTRLAAILVSRMTLRTDRGLVPDWYSIEPLPAEMELRLRFRAAAPPAGAMTLDANLFPYDPLHQTFVNIYEGEQLRQQMIFSADTPAHTYYLGTAQGAVAVMRTFIPSGIHHILIGPDHILFLIGLLLLGGTWRALLTIVTAFTVGHSITLSLAALNLVTPPPALIEPAIALSIVFVGTDNLVRGSGRDVRAWVALVFGLVHGFGFANVLRQFGLPKEALGWSLFSFNVGVEIGQLSIVLIVATALAAIRRHSSPMAHRIAYAGSLVVIAAGSYWFVQRVFFPGAA